MLRTVDLIRADVSEERIASIIRVTRIGELEKKTLATEARSEEQILTTTFFLSIRKLMRQPSKRIYSMACTAGPGGSVTVCIFGILEITGSHLPRV
jgi:hypothetical protein